MASNRSPRTPNHRSGGRARDRAVIRVRRVTTLIGLAAAMSAAGLGVLVASETTVSGQTTTTTTSTSSGASAGGSASAGTTSTSDPSTTTTTAPATHTVSGQS